MDAEKKASSRRAENGEAPEAGGDALLAKAKADYVPPVWSELEECAFAAGLAAHKVAHWQPAQLAERARSDALDEAECRVGWKQPQVDERAAAILEAEAEDAARELASAVEEQRVADDRLAAALEGASATERQRVAEQQRRSAEFCARARAAATEDLQQRLDDLWW